MSDQRDFFISHSSKDGNFAFKLVEELEGRGLKCWIAPRNIAPGNTYLRAIPAAVENCETTVLLLSREAMDSEFVLREIETALKLRKTMIPVRIEEIQPEGDFAFVLGPSQWVDAFQGAELERLNSAVSGLLGGDKELDERSLKSSLSEGSDQKEEKRVRQLAWPVMIMAAITMLAWLGHRLSAKDKEPPASSDSVEVTTGASLIEMPLSEFDLALELADERSVYREGESVSFRFKAAQDCYVALFQSGKERDVLLFPNMSSSDPFLKGGVNVTVPDDASQFDIGVGPPFGEETVYLVASSDSDDLNEMIGHLDLHELPWSSERPYLDVPKMRRLLYVKARKEEKEDQVVRAFAELTFRTAP